MSKTAHLVFTYDGLMNPDHLADIWNNKSDRVVLFGDGSEEAYHHIRNFDLNNLRGTVRFVGIAKTPLYDLRVISPDGKVSKPHYTDSEETKRRWICQNICVPYIHLSVSDITSQSGTQVQLDERNTELVCSVAHEFWGMLKVAEARLAFPAAIIDAMTQWTYSLTPETIDIGVLRKHVGLNSLDYHSPTDMLSVTVGGEMFAVKLSVLNSLYGEYLLPYFNSIFGRRMQIQASVKGLLGQSSDFTVVSYGQLGRIIDELMVYAKVRKITSDRPMSHSDLASFAKKVRIDDTSCVWLGVRQTMANLADFYYADIVRAPYDHPEGDDDLDESSPDLDAERDDVRSESSPLPFYVS